MIEASADHRLAAHLIVQMMAALIQEGLEEAQAERMAIAFVVEIARQRPPESP